MTTRREFLRTLSGAGTMGVVWLRPETATAEPPPETTALRLTQVRGACIAPQYVAEELLRAEGFTDVRYVQKAGRVETLKAVASGEVPITVGSLGPILIQIDEGDPLVLLAGVHVGCFVLFATESVRTIRDLKGKTVGVTELGSGRHVFLASAMAWVGLDPRKDVTFAVRRVRSMPTRRSPKKPRSCARGESAASCSTARRIVHGLSTPAASWR